jgi:hypothetical protein
MKKVIFTTILALIGVMAITSCTDDAKKGDQLTTMLTIESSQDLIDVCDIQITYKGKGSVNTIDTITTTKWHKIIVNDSFPTKIGLVVLRYLVKPGFKPTKDFYNLECRYRLTCKEQEHRNGYSPLRMPDVPGDKIASILEMQNYMHKDTEEREAKQEVFISSIDIVTKAKNGSTGDPFDIKFEGETDSSSVQLVEEQPVLGPDHVNQQAPAAANNK